MQVRASVKVVNPDHPRYGQAGQVIRQADNNPDASVVRFDLDQADIEVGNGELVELGQN